MMSISMKSLLLPNSGICQSIERFLRSDWYLLWLVSITVYPFAYGAYFVGLWLCALTMCFCLVVHRDILPSFAAFVFATISVFEMYRATYEQMFSVRFIAIPVVLAFVFHMVYYRPTGYRPSRSFYAQLAVSVAITLAGIFTTTAKEYFTLPNLYFTVALGFGLLAMLVILELYLPQDRNYMTSYFARTMMYVGLLVILMWIVAVIQDIPEMNEGFRIPYRQWKNNVGNLMLIAVPLTLYYGTRSRQSWLCMLFATLEFGAILFSMSRGSMMVAIVLAPIEYAAFFYYLKDKRARLLNLIILGTMAALTLCILFANGKRLLEYLEGLLQVHEDESRWDLYIEGVNNFYRAPWFGVGFGYRNNEVYPLNDMAIFWYHSTPVQIIASMGIMGVIAYAYQFWIRLRLCLRNSAFHIFCMLGFAAFEGYSCVNTGDFSPLPFCVLIVMMFLLCEHTVPHPAPAPVVIPDCAISAERRARIRRLIGQTDRPCYLSVSDNSEAIAE